jgi:iron complex transport system ATP-binding protein
MDIVNDPLQQVGSSDLAERQIDTLSDGERQKVMIAKALAQQTPVIYLDEPTAFLDFPSKVEVLLLLRRISQASQKVIFLSTHDVELALQVADRIWLMDKSTRKLFIGTAQELAQDGILSRFIERNGIHFNSDTLTIQIDKTA